MNFNCQVHKTSVTKLYFLILGLVTQNHQFSIELLVTAFHAKVSVRRICQVKTDSARVRFMPIKLHLSSDQNVGCLRLHSPPKACPGKMLRAKGDDANSSGANFLGTLDSHDDSRKFHPEATKPTQCALPATIFQEKSGTMGPTIVFHGRAVPSMFFLNRCRKKRPELNGVGAFKTKILPAPTASLLHSKTMDFFCVFGHLEGVNSTFWSQQMDHKMHQS